MAKNKINLKKLEKNLNKTEFGRAFSEFLGLKKPTRSQRLIATTKQAYTGPNRAKTIAATAAAGAATAVAGYALMARASR